MKTDPYCIVSDGIVAH